MTRTSRVDPSVQSSVQVPVGPAHGSVSVVALVVQGSLEVFGVARPAIAAVPVRVAPLGLGPVASVATRVEVSGVRAPGVRVVPLEQGVALPRVPVGQGRRADRRWAERPGLQSLLQTRIEAVSVFRLPLGRATHFCYHSDRLRFGTGVQIRSCVTYAATMACTVTEGRIGTCHFGSTSAT